MMIPKAIADKLNAQIGYEFQAAHNYLHMACKLDDMGLKNFSKWFRLQGQEERQHAEKILDYLLQVGAPVSLGSIQEPKANTESVESIVQTALSQEESVTKQINEIVELANKEKDYATHAFIQWFVTEQVEEVSTMHDLLNLVKLAGPNIIQLEAYMARLNAGRA